MKTLKHGRRRLQLTAIGRSDPALELLLRRVVEDEWGLAPAAQDDDIRPFGKLDLGLDVAAPDAPSDDAHRTNSSTPRS